RRSVIVAASEGLNLDLVKNAGQAVAARAGACFVYPPERAEHAARVIGTTRQGVTGAGGPLASGLRNGSVACRQPASRDPDGGTRPGRPAGRRRQKLNGGLPPVI